MNDWSAHVPTIHAESNHSKWQIRVAPLCLVHGVAAFGSASFNLNQLLPAPFSASIPELGPNKAKHPN